MKYCLKLKWLIPGILLLLCSLLILLPHTELYENSPDEISTGILLDLLITIPLLYSIYIWKKHIPKFTIIYVIILGILIANYLIPTADQQLLYKVQLMVIPLLEIGILSLVIYKMKSLRQRFVSLKEIDFFSKVTIACHEVFPARIAKVIATEMAVVYYLISSPSKEILKPNHFTYDKKSGIKIVLTVFIFLILIETFVVHLLISNWNENIAWILTFLSVYAILQVIAIMKSMSRRLISIDYEHRVLNLNYGFGCQSNIPFNHIINIGVFNRNLREGNMHIYLSLFELLDTSNVSIELKIENVLNKLYGIE